MQIYSNDTFESSGILQGSPNRVQEDRALIPNSLLIDDSIPLL
jgi:hypothetical protein